MTKKLSKKQKEYYFSKRYQRLLDEGFSAEEADLLANVRISKGGFLRSRRERKKKYEALLRQGVSPMEAKKRIVEQARGENKLFIDWATFRKEIYPDNRKLAIASA